MLYKTINDAASITNILAEGKVKIHYTRDSLSEDMTDTARDLVREYELFPTSLLEKYDHSRLKQLVPFTHTCMGSILGSDDFEDIFMAMQGEVWSPNGEARDLVFKKESSHTSMSVGDIIELEDGRMFLVAGFGFTEL